MRIAVVQQQGNPGQPEQNRHKALAYARQALDQGADVVLFHEELLAGYTPYFREMAEPIDGPTTQAFQCLLAGRHSLIVYGLAERDGADLFISAPVVAAEGVVANYRKAHLWWDAEGLRNEARYFRAGDRLVDFEVCGCRCGLMICYDGDFPEMTRAYACRGCAVLLWLNNRGSRGHDEVRDLARRNSMIIATSCCCGPNEVGQPCRGGSNITGADGQLLAEIWDHEGIVVADVDLIAALGQRERNPMFRGRRPELYA